MCNLRTRIPLTRRPTYSRGAPRLRNLPPTVMCADPGAATREALARQVRIDDAQFALLRSDARPVVLLPRTPSCTLPDIIAPGLREIGVLLPYSPLHHLLLDAFGAPLVATSGNVS